MPSIHLVCCVGCIWSVVRNEGPDKRNDAININRNGHHLDLTDP